MRKLILFFLAILLITCVFAQEEILLQVNLFDDGSALIVGSSTIDPQIQDIEYEKKDQTFYGYTQEMTSKSGSKWTFSLGLDQEFSSSYVKIILPEDAKIGDIDSNMDSFTSIGGTNIIIEFTGTNLVPEIGFDYEIGITEKGGDNSIYFLIGAVIAAGIIILIWLFFRKKKGKKKEKGEPRKEKEKQTQKTGKRKINALAEKLKPIRATLNERENQIIKELLEHKKLKQNQLQHLTKIPKVSLSRHLVNLENKNLILKKSLGKTNIIQINKNFDKKAEKQ